MDQALPRQRASRALRWCLIVSAAVHLVLLLWVSGVVRVDSYSQIQVSLFQQRPHARALPRPRLRPPEPEIPQPTDLLNTPRAPLPVPQPRMMEVPQAAPDDSSLAIAAPTTTPLPAGSLAPPTLAVTQAELDVYHELVRQLVEREKRYPPQARKRQIEGRVTLYFVISPKGRLAALKVIKSAGFKLLDRGAQEAVRRAAPFPPLPPGSPVNGLGMELTIAYELY